MALDYLWLVASAELVRLAAAKPIRAAKEAVVNLRSFNISHLSVENKWEVVLANKKRYMMFQKLPNWKSSIVSRTQHRIPSLVVGHESVHGIIL
jgi:hypothetical protein